MIKIDAVADDLKPDQGMIIVEPPLLVPTETKGKFSIPEYRYRKPAWGKTFSLSYAQFSPFYYEPNFYLLLFNEIYARDDLPLIEMTFSLKRNLQIGSIGVEFGVGFYQNESDSSDFPSTLKVIPVRLGGVLLLDNLFTEPYVAPYLAAGIYTIHYSESLEKTSFNGFTQASFYVSAGLMFQLNWCDPSAARDLYLDSRVENTFLYVEGRKFFASSAAKDPDFETDFSPGGGIRVEF